MRTMDEFKEVQDDSNWLASSLHRRTSGSMKLKTSIPKSRASFNFQTFLEHCVAGKAFAEQSQVVHPTSIEVSAPTQ